jgi:gamma-glutamylcyclotransferase (GGCT)/AIG2-like uncharacterized protein YtfP
MGMSNKVNVFTYGTLMSPGTFFTMSGMTRPDFSLVKSECAVLYGYSRNAVKDAHFPAIVKDAQSKVLGVLWQDVDESVLHQLDSYEGCPDLYTREKAQVQTTEELIQAYIYVWGRGDRGLTKGPWERASSLAQQHPNYGVISGRLAAGAL